MSSSRKTYKCKHCTKIVYRYPSQLKSENVFCSQRCKGKYSTLAGKGPPSRKGSSWSDNQRKAFQIYLSKPSTKKRLRQEIFDKKPWLYYNAKSGVEANAWKGDNVKYRGLHSWVERALGKPHRCEYCKNDTLSHRQYHWANISKKYKRDLKDWVRLCAKCHRAFDNKKIKI